MFENAYRVLNGDYSIYSNKEYSHYGSYFNPYKNIIDLDLKSFTAKMKDDIAFYEELLLLHREAERYLQFFEVDKEAFKEHFKAEWQNYNNAYNIVKPIYDLTFILLDTTPNYIIGLKLSLYKAGRNVGRQELHKKLKRANYLAILDLAGSGAYEAMIARTKTALNTFISVKKFIIQEAKKKK